MHYVRKVFHCKHPSSAPGSATGLCCHLKLIECKRVKIRGHYFASYCQSPKPDFLIVSETPDEYEYFSADRTFENQDQSSLMLKN